jgi:hypothetical protein
MLLPVFRSARRRRVALRVAAVALALAAVAGIIVALPSKTPSHRDTLRPGRPQVERAQEHVALTAARRRAVNGVLDRFVPAALERRNLDVARRLVTSSFAAGVSDAQWRRGDIPVLPYKPRDTRFHGWRLNYSYAREISLDLLVQPSAREQLGAIAFTAVLKRTPRGWLIDEFAPAASFAPQEKAPRILAQPDFQPNMVQGAHTNGRLGASWLAVPVALLALIALVPLAFFVRSKLVDRRAMRNYRGLYERAS